VRSATAAARGWPGSFRASNRGEGRRPRRRRRAREPRPRRRRRGRLDPRRRGHRRRRRADRGRDEHVAEYRGLLLGLRKARELGASEIEVVNDSELVAKQVNGTYKVKHPDMKPLHAAALQALRDFERWSIRSVPRAQNAAADALVNQALDAARHS